ncbi:MAG: transposase [Bacteroidota bacterium]|nr:transposase [Bacteroidota bacterium]
MLDFYSNYIISSFDRVTATSGARLTDDTISHDRITRFLNDETSSRNLWQHVKRIVRDIQSPDGVIIVDDTIIAKPHMDENEIVCWHYDHQNGKYVKGMNLISFLYESNAVHLPVSYAIIEKTELYTDDSTGCQKRRSSISKNKYFQRLLRTCRRNNLPFRYVLSDVWYASAENMNFVRRTLKRHFVMPLKSNRKVALSKAHKRVKNYVTVETLDYTNSSLRTIYLEEVEFPLLLVKQVFTNEDGSEGILYLVTSDTTLTYEKIIALYQKRWSIECYHKALKQQCGVGRSPARTMRTQSTHIHCSMCAFVKLELLSKITSVSHEGLKLNLHIHAIKTSFKYLQSLQPFNWATKPIFA